MTHYPLASRREYHHTIKSRQIRIKYDLTTWQHVLFQFPQSCGPALLSPLGPNEPNDDVDVIMVIT